ncbi:AAA family ATPase [Serratia fonticola]
MHICYIWIKQFKCFLNYGLNLSSDHTFNFDQTNLNLSYKDNQSLPENFFGPNISGVTALLGVNGSGKTTALELICRCITEHYHLKDNYILIYKEGDDFYISNNFNGNIIINFPYIKDDENIKLRELKTIYFSNVFDQNHLEFDDKVIDISINRKMNPKYIYKDDLAKKTGEIESQILFLQSKKAEEIELNIPDRIEYKLLKNTTDALRKIEKIGVSKHEKHELIINLISTLRRIFISERNEHRYRKAIGVHYSSMLIRQQFIVSLIKLNPKILRIIADSIEDVKFTSNSVSILETVSAETDIHFSEHSLSEMIDIFILNIDDWLKAFNYESEQSIQGSKHSFTVEINKKNLWHHTKLSYIFEMMLDMDVAWHGISSGQKAYLNMFSSIWNCIEENNKSNDNNHTLICIDEGDLYLHPQWQIEFVDRLTNCLPKISNGNVQIIFTTHSPLLISDMPNQCVCVLYNSNYKQDIELKTFGANIYDIYKYVFDMGEHRTGNKSNRYIKRVFDILDKKSINKKDLDFLIEAKKIINNNLILQHIDIKLNEK